MLLYITTFFSKFFHEHTLYILYETCFFVYIELVKVYMPQITKYSN